ncbi:hypothetical protein SpiBuddy_0266 [Sphaerochaeta globosa str. Buddy]|uniref:O-antigen polymerase n=2 Tax=Sphaerochaeta TaxID=399320 RepID=F0RXQ4_SPHGB|nr:hypothetical protein SpiBuddy_0266 [Sphaerochaeta globosa str. Buddy]
MKLVFKNNQIILKILTLFFTVFSIRLKVIPVTPRIIVLVSVLLYVFFMRGFHYTKDDIKWLIKCFFVFLFTLFSVFLNSANQTDSELPLYSAFNFLIFVGLFPFLLIDVFDDELQFCRALGIAGTIQSIIVIMSALIPLIRTLLQEIQNIDFSRYNYRIFGLGIAGSGGSIYLFCGLFAIAYWIICTKKISIWLTLIYIINFFAITLVGRTGFYAAIIVSLCLFIIVGRNGVWKPSALFGWSFFILIGMIFLYNYVTSVFESNTEVLLYTFRRLGEGFNYSDSETIEKLSLWNDRIIPLSFRTLFIGTGVTRGYSYDGLLVSHDGGYAKRYMSIGLVMALYSYVIYYNYLRKMIKRITGKKGIIVICLLIMLVIEYKEPFMYQLALPFTVLMIVKLKLKAQVQKKEKKWQHYLKKN